MIDLSIALYTKPSEVDCLTHVGREGSAEHPILAAIDRIVAHCDPCSP